MNAQGKVVAYAAKSGLLAVELNPESYVLAEHIHGDGVETGQSLNGEMDVFGEAEWTRTDTGAPITVFVQAYDISKEAVELALR